MAERTGRLLALSQEECALCCGLVAKFGGSGVVVFGSTLWKLVPGDLDLAVTGVKVEQVDSLRKALETGVGKVIDIKKTEALCYNPLLADIIKKFG